MCRCTHACCRASRQGHPACPVACAQSLGRICNYCWITCRCGTMADTLAGSINASFCLQLLAVQVDAHPSSSINGRYSLACRLACVASQHSKSLQHLIARCSPHAVLYLVACLGHDPDEHRKAEKEGDYGAPAPWPAAHRPPARRLLNYSIAQVLPPVLLLGVRPRLSCHSCGRGLLSSWRGCHRLCLGLWLFDPCRAHALCGKAAGKGVGGHMTAGALVLVMGGGRRRRTHPGRSGGWRTAMPNAGGCLLAWPAPPLLPLRVRSLLYGSRPAALHPRRLSPAPPSAVTPCHIKRHDGSPHQVRRLCNDLCSGLARTMARLDLHAHLKEGRNQGGAAPG